jgi:O-antigen/teichoic acid export membrane protein
LLLARTVGFVFTLALPLLLVRLFDRTQIGIYRQIFLVISTATNVLPLGFQVSVFYYLPRETERRGTMVFNVVMYLLGAGLLAFATILIWPGVLDLIVGSNVLRPYSTLIGVTILLWIFAILLDVVATANEDVALSTVFIITVQVTRTIFLVANVLIFHTIESLLYGAILVGLFQSGILLWYLNSRFPKYWHTFSWKIFGEQAAYVLPFGVAGIVYTMQSDLNSYMVAHRFAPAQFALYSVGASPLPLVTLLRDSVNSVLLPRVSGMQQRGATDEIRALMFRAVRKLALVYLPVCAGVLALGHELLITLYTKQYVEGYPILALNAILLPIGALISDPVFRAHSEYRFILLRIRSVMIVFMFLFALWAIPHFGMAGAMAAFVLTAGIERVLFFRISMKILHMRRSDWKSLAELLKFVAISAVAGLAASGVRFLFPGLRPQFILLLGMAVFGVVYAGFVLGLGLLVDDEKQIVNRYTSRFLRL